jgi:hypothetical protein
MRHFSRPITPVPRSMPHASYLAPTRSAPVFELFFCGFVVVFLRCCSVALFCPTRKGTCRAGGIAGPGFPVEPRERPIALITDCAFRVSRVPVFGGPRREPAGPARGCAPNAPPENQHAPREPARASRAAANSRPKEAEEAHTESEDAEKARKKKEAVERFRVKTKAAAEPKARGTQKDGGFGERRRKRGRSAKNRMQKLSRTDVGAF